MQRDGGPGGAGGAGNPTGGSFTGPALALEIIGDHIFGYSGQIAASTTGQNALKFNTGNYYAVVTVEFSGYMSPGDPTNGTTGNAMISLNDTIVGELRTAMDISVSGNPQNSDCQIIIPAYTEFKVSVDAGANSAAKLATISVTGRIYRG